MNYCKVRLEGDIKFFKESLQEKLSQPSLKVQKINDNTALIISEIPDIIDDVSYLINIQLSNDIKILEVEEATKADCISDNDFELINNEDIDSKTKIVDNIVGDLTTSINFNEGSSNNDVFCEKTAVKNLNNAVVNTILNSKTPLYKDDPFNVVMNPQFCLYTMFATSLLVFISSLF